jgi:hypothetical protein
MEQASPAPLKQRLSRLLLEFSSHWASVKSGALVQASCEALPSRVFTSLTANPQSECAPWAPSRRSGCPSTVLTARWC